MTVQVEVFFNLHRFYFFGKEACIMPEQSAHRQDEDPVQQKPHKTKSKGDAYENHRRCCFGRIQCRN